MKFLIIFFLLLAPVAQADTYQTCGEIWGYPYTIGTWETADENTYTMYYTLSKFEYQDSGVILSDDGIGIMEDAPTNNRVSWWIHNAQVGAWSIYGYTIIYDSVGGSWLMGPHDDCDDVVVVY